MLYVGKAQEKARVMRTERRRSRRTGGTYPWIVDSTAMVNHYYFYCVDEDFGPFFLKFCSYFPYNAKLCINGHEYLKRQLAKRGVAFQALDNGIKSCADPTCCVASAMDCRRGGSINCCASGSNACRIRFRRDGYIAFQMAEVAIPRQMFQEILRLIAELRPQPPPAPA